MRVPDTEHRAGVGPSGAGAEEPAPRARRVPAGDLRARHRRDDRVEQVQGRTQGRRHHYRILGASPPYQGGQEPAARGRTGREPARCAAGRGQAGCAMAHVRASRRVAGAAEQTRRHHRHAGGAGPRPDGAGRRTVHHRAGRRSGIAGFRRRRGTSEGAVRRPSRAGHTAGALPSRT